MKKLIISTLALSALLFSSVPALAWIRDVPPVVVIPVVQCGAQAPITKSEDYDNSKVDINFHNNDSQVVVTPKSGYTLTSVGVDYTGSDANEATVPVGDGLSAVTYDAPFKEDSDKRESIDHVTVVVSKTCTPVCTDKEANNVGEVIEGQSVEDNTTCTYTVVVPTPVVATPSATPKVSTLPQTGNFNWPLAALIAAGLVSAGAVIKFAARKG